MTQRLNYAKASPEMFKAMLGVEQVLHGVLEAGLLHRAKLRASQINGCAYCIDMHWKDARAAFNDKELADLTWAIGLINAWNRVAIGFRVTAGGVQACSPCVVVKGCLGVVFCGMAFCVKIVAGGCSVLSCAGVPG